MEVCGRPDGTFMTIGDLEHRDITLCDDGQLYYGGTQYYGPSGPVAGPAIVTFLRGLAAQGWRYATAPQPEIPAVVRAEVERIWREEPSYSDAPHRSAVERDEIGFYV